MQGAGCRVQGAGCRMQNAGCRVQGAGCRVPPPPKTHSLEAAARKSIESLPAGGEPCKREILYEMCFNVKDFWR